VSRRNLIWMCVILAAVIVMVCVAGPKPRPVPATDPDAEALAEAVRAYKVLRQKSYQPPAPAEACRGAIEGMARCVDEHSCYLCPDEAARLGRRLGGKLCETGLRVAERGGRITIVGALPDSPAHKAALHAGMEVEAINGVEAKYLTAAEADEILRGADAPVMLKWRTASGSRVQELDPDEFNAETVLGLVRDAEGRWRFDLDERGLYYIRITEFVPHTPGAFHEAYRSLSEPRGLVLDLRGNPGGQLQMAAEIADRFLSAGEIVRTVHGGGRPYVHHAYPTGTYPPVPLVVLIDERTASAAEILAGALRIHRRALLVGRPSYGKWSVQTAVPLGGGQGTLYLTTGRYVLPAPEPTTTAAATRPAGNPGDLPDRVLPDVDVRLTAQAARRLERLWLGAMVMPAPPGEATMGEDLSRLRRDLLGGDRQLAAAVKLLLDGQADPERIAASRPARGAAP